MVPHFQARLPQLAHQLNYPETKIKMVFSKVVEDQQQDHPAISRQDPLTIKRYLVSAAIQNIGEVRHFIETLGFHPGTTFGGKPTALCYALLKQDRCLTQYLIMHGADVNSRDQMGMPAIPVRDMQQVGHLIYRDFLHKDRGKWGHGWPIGAINQMLNRSNGNDCGYATITLCDTGW